MLSTIVKHMTRWPSSTTDDDTIPAATAARSGSGDTLARRFAGRARVVDAREK